MAKVVLSRMPPASITRLEETCDIWKWEEDRPIPRDLLLEQIGSAEGLFTMIPDQINAELLGALIDAGTIPVIAPVARDPSGGKLNVNADLVAGHVAAAIRAEKLVLVSDTHGIRTSAEPDSLATHLTKSQIQALVDQGVITTGMLPKVEACAGAVAGGVGSAHILDGTTPHVLILEIFTDAGVGTMVVADPPGSEVGR